MIGVLTRMPWEDTETHKEEHRVKTEAETGGIELQTKECQGTSSHQKSGRDKKRSFIRSFRGSMTLLTL